MSDNQDGFDEKDVQVWKWTIEGMSKNILGEFVEAIHYNSLMAEREALKSQLEMANGIIKFYSVKHKRDCHHDDPSWCTEFCNDHGFKAREYLRGLEKK